jgi:uncharacterized membrane protein HdeD (DUF308 family)
MIFAAILAILMGIYEIRYAYKYVEKENKSIRNVFITMGITTIVLGFIMIIINFTTNA